MAESRIHSGEQNEAGKIEPFALVGGILETVTRGRLEVGTIIVGRDGKISAVGKNPRIPKGIKTLDANGAVITPGLIDAHCHAGMAEDGFPKDRDISENTEPVTPHMMAIDAFKPADPALLDAARAGVTTVFITPGSSNVIGGIGAVVKTWSMDYASQVVDPAAGMKMATGENPKHTFGERNRMPGSRMGVAALMRETFTAAVNYMAEKKAAEKKKNRTFAVDIRMEALARVLRGEFPARCHAHRASDMMAFLRIADEFGIKYTFEHATECMEIVGELLAKNVTLVLGPAFGSRYKRELFQKSFATVNRAVRQGLTVALTADHDVTPLRFLNVYAALAVREGLPEEEALKTITINPARIIGQENKLGSLEKGKWADLVVWDGDPLDARSKPACVFIAGRPVPNESPPMP